jgi:hypothetical protein
MDRQVVRTTSIVWAGDEGTVRCSVRLAATGKTHYHLSDTVFI